MKNSAIILKNLIERTLTGAIYVVVISGAIWFHPYSFLGLFMVITGLALWEFFALTGRKDAHRYIEIAGGVYLFAVSFFYAAGDVAGYVYLPYLFFLLYMLVAGLYRVTSDPVHEWAMKLFAQFYIAGLLSLLNFIAFASGTYACGCILLIFAFVWLNDTAAYLIGTSFGKHPLFPRVSPLKSWEGFAGGLSVVLLSALVMSYYIPDLFGGWQQWVILAAVIVVFGTWGDLIESLLKRTYGVKDSGKLLPGHGGLLDRIDSALLAAPAVYICLKIIGGW